MSLICLILYEGPSFTIEWYYDSEGRSRAREFFLALSDKRKAALLVLAKRMGDTGQIRDITKFRNEGHKIFAFKPQPERFLCFFFIGKKIVITNAFVKKSDKLPAGEKEKALLCKNDYERRVKQENYYEKLKKL